MTVNSSSRIVLSGAVLLLLLGAAYWQFRKPDVALSAVRTPAMEPVTAEVPSAGGEPRRRLPREPATGGSPPATALTGNGPAQTGDPVATNQGTGGPAGESTPVDGDSDSPSTPVNSVPLEPLIAQAGKQALIAKDGSVLRIEVSPGNPATTVNFQAWTDDSQPDAAGHYDWRFRIALPEGGLVERTDRTAWTAPETGYSEAFEFSMERSVPAGEWKHEMGQSFYVHFADNTYGILDVQMVAGGAHFITVRSSLNPAAGSRNLQPPPPPRAYKR